MHISINESLTIYQKVYSNLDIWILLIILAIFTYSCIVLYSASNQSLYLLTKHCINFVIALSVMLTVACINLSRYKHLIPLLYCASIILLIAVTLFGIGAMGAQRWLDIGFMRIQPSELIKFSVPLTVAWFITLHSLPPNKFQIMIVIIIMLIPTVMVAQQPDLGTSIIIATSGIFVLFLAGIQYKFILITILSAIAAIPIMWKYVLLDYQKNRVISLFNPEQDALGAGWNIIQSKIAVGSGGIFGKGWLDGTQSHFNFLPESTTDFIIAVLAEEFGLLGVLLLLALYTLLIARALVLALRADNSFNRLLVGSIIMVFFSYIFINIGMVTGILPVVGMPLPLFSYGGSSLVSIMLSFGIMMSVSTHKQLLPR